ncbi:MAG TPA: hypothetical protein VH331_12705 [Allosphingosinicella sp.]|jgi:hypothetical protein|nr:hypothetical protein [Allosphingosinicella sp.]
MPKIALRPLGAAACALLLSGCGGASNPLIGSWQVTAESAADNCSIDHLTFTASNVVQHTRAIAGYKPYETTGAVTYSQEGQRVTVLGVGAFSSSDTYTVDDANHITDGNNTCRYQREG